MTKAQNTEPEIKNASAKLSELLALIDPQAQARQLNQLKSLTSRLVRINTPFPHSEQYGHPRALAVTLSFRHVIHRSVTR